MVKYRFTAFKAVDDPDSCFRFIEGHKKLLEIYGISMITSNTPNWVYHDNTYVILVESIPDKRVLGGARVQLVDESIEVPLIEAVGKVDRRIFDLVFNPHFKTAELCGLWNSKAMAMNGVGSLYLGWTGITVARILGVQKLHALCAPATVKYCLRLGFTIQETVGNKGIFNYPKDNMIATVMTVEDLVNLPTSEEEIRKTIFALSLNPIQNVEYNTRLGRVLIEYVLKIKP
ncbi:hypothetical protein [Thermoflavifilum thermophilum]|uniref:N-acyl-L-homoserine lactone synthetase n=1 Tax=Thermoflavifilum thermophilum TaxID=1393122 RepID=A0A1I7NE58_9BACT|nr:hypothetical protein [Thermoflavifilum thermophilum]SFV32931.1 hypothetical protein SAMN05660895_1501 [Thermoflavifilum thermophilum]